MALKRVALWAHPAAILIGLAAGWQWFGLRMVLASAMDPLPATSIMLGVIALLSAAVGPWVPERIVLAVTRFIGRRSRRIPLPAGDHTGTFWILQAVRNRDEALLWLALSVLATLAGLVSLLTLGVGGIFLKVFYWLLEHFFWTNLTLAMLEWTLAAAVLGLPWLLNGLIVSMLSPVIGLRWASPRDPVGVTGGILLGLALAHCTHTAVADHGLSGEQAYLLGVLPMFVLAGVAAKMSQAADLPPRVSEEMDSAAPELSAGTEGFVWFSLVVWGMASTLVILGWVNCRADAAWGEASRYYFSGCVLLLSLGVALASFGGRRPSSSRSGCGMALWAAGIGAGAAATLTAYWPTGAWAGVSQAVALALPAGFALQYVERAWLARAGRETLGFAQLTSALLAGLAVGLIAAQWYALPALGPVGVMTAGALLMLAYGGLMQIYEKDRSARILHQRLAWVFASLAAGILIFPHDARRWAECCRHRPAPAVAELNLAQPPEGIGSRVCVLGAAPSPAAAWLADHQAQGDWFPLIADDFRGQAASSTDHLHIGNMSALRNLRLERTRYALIYQRNDLGRPGPRHAEYSVEWFTRLARHAAVGGRMVIDVPLPGLTKEALAVIAATFEHAINSPVLARVFDDYAYVRLEALMDADGRTEAFWDGRCFPAGRLFAAGAALHSIRRDQLSGLLPHGKDKAPLEADLRQWLRQACFR